MHTESARRLGWVPRIPMPHVAGVYFIRPREGGPIKIGESGNIEERIVEIQACCPYELTLVGIVRVNDEAERKAIERALHARLAKHRLHGEWFADHPDVYAVRDEIVVGEYLE